MGTASKFLFAQGMTPIELVQFRSFATALCLLLGMFIFRPGDLKIQKKDLVDFLVVGICTGGNFFCYFYAIQKIPVGIAILLELTAPIWIGLYCFFIRGESHGLLTWASIGLSFLGMAFVLNLESIGDGSLITLGYLGGIGAAITFTIASLVQDRMLKKYSNWTILLGMQLGAALVLNIVHSPLAIFHNTYSLSSWLWLGFIVVFGTILPFSFLLLAIKWIGPTKATTVVTAEPILAAIFAYFFLGELLISRQIVGIFIVIFALILLGQQKIIADFFNKRFLMKYPKIQKSIH